MARILGGYRWRYRSGVDESRARLGGVRAAVWGRPWERYRMTAAWALDLRVQREVLRGASFAATTRAHENVHRCTCVSGANGMATSEGAIGWSHHSGTRRTTPLLLGQDPAYTTTPVGLRSAV